MIIDLHKFIDAERGFWKELEGILDRFERDPEKQLDLKGLERFHYLYERAAAGLCRVATFAAEPHTRRYLEALVARAYAEIHEVRQHRLRRGWLQRVFYAFPMTVRRRRSALGLSVLATLVGAAFGVFLLAAAPQYKDVILPFDGLHGTPAERVAREEAATVDRLAGHKGRFASQLMANNIQVSINALALGIAWGVGTLIILFYNGVALGVVGLDYLLSGQARFLFGWLLPHGAIEIPAILIAGQAGLVLGGALLGNGRSQPLRQRLKQVWEDLVVLIAGVAVMLVWAGIVEAFLSQYHEPVIAYEVKIGFGAFELLLLAFYLGRAGAGAGAAAGTGGGSRP
jgi:uncharacterized membrane protein SpoIIM required for sporulation